MTDTLHLNFESGIKDLIEAFKSNPYSFYSENDLHCKLFHTLSLKGLNASCISKLGKSKVQSSILHKEYPTKGRYKRNNKGPSLKKRRGKRGYFDICLWDPKLTNKRQFKTSGGKNEQKTFTAVEMSLNEHHGTFEWHVYWDLLKLSDPVNEVENGYILFFVRDYPYKKTGFSENGFIDKLKEMFGEEKKVHIIYIEYVKTETRIVKISNTDFTF